MTSRQHPHTLVPEPSVIDRALEVMEAEELRAIIRDIIPWLDELKQRQLVNELVDRTTRSGKGQAPAGPSTESVLEIEAFAEAARRIGYADPIDVDDYLRMGSHAFLGKDYEACLRIFRALLPPIGECEIDLGQHEMVSEVLKFDVDSCAAQYVVATYMTTAPAERAEAVGSAIAEVDSVSFFCEPLSEMESVAVEALPELDLFLKQWRAHIEGMIVEHQSYWATDMNRWLREVVERLDGVAGLAEIARSTRRADDLRAWCNAVVKDKDWEAALLAYEEAAEIVTDRSDSGEFLDGAARAAQELGRGDLPARLERAWREAPNLSRLQRWLGSSGSKSQLRRRASRVISVCPEEAHKQLAILHVLLGKPVLAAKLLAAAPGLGWSAYEHPGHLLFSLFCRLLGNQAAVAGQDAATDAASRVGTVVHELLRRLDNDLLVTPPLEEIIEIAGIGTVPAADRSEVIKALRTTAENRIAGVTKHKRRRFYGHAASLAASCMAIDPSPESAEWMATLRTKYRRYSTLQREFKRLRV
jgi:hypothetical protein